MFDLPFPRGMAIVCGLILLLDNLANDASEILIARRHVFLANSLMFVRQGFWPLPVILIGLLDPSARTLEFLLACWLAALVATCIGIAAIAIHRARWRHAAVRARLLAEGLRGGMILYVKDVSGVFGAFIDRFLISLVLGLELTGVYTLFWSITNVVHSLSVFGVLQTHIARILGAGSADDAAAFASLERKLQLETGAWALILAAGAAVVTPLLLPWLGRPLLETSLPVFWVLLAATFLRIAADGYGFALLALHRDRAIALIAVGGALLSAALNAALTPLFGIMGAALAAVVTGAGLFLSRYLVCRRALGS
jgi:O-antigen/teichoic acid export membrane protein